MYVRLTRGEAFCIRDLLKALMDQDVNLEDLERDIFDCYDIIHAVTRDAPSPEKQLDLFDDIEE